MTAFARIDGCVLHHSFREGRGPAVVFLNSLGTDFRIWDDVVAGLPGDIAVLRMDKRGHGLSQAAEGDMRRFAHDAAGLMDRYGLTGALVCGVSIGGCIAQELALARPDLVSGLVLSNTAAKIGSDEMWSERIGNVEKTGLPAMADGVLERWFAAGFRSERTAELEGYRAMLSRTPAEGYINACRALKAWDARDRIGALDIPTVCIGGSDDLSTPPETVRGLSESIPGAEYVEIDGVGHLPCIERPEAVLRVLLDMHPTLR